VTGTVRHLARPDLERDYDWIDFDGFREPDVLVRFQTRPVVLADSVRTAKGDELVQAEKEDATAGTKATEKKQSKSDAKCGEACVCGAPDKMRAARALRG
jgi:hypothetical protein